MIIARLGATAAPVASSPIPRPRPTMPALTARPVTAYTAPTVGPRLATPRPALPYAPYAPAAPVRPRVSQLGPSLPPPETPQPLYPSAGIQAKASATVEEIAEGGATAEEKKPLWKRSWLWGAVGALAAVGGHRRFPRPTALVA